MTDLHSTIAATTVAKTEDAPMETTRRASVAMNDPVGDAAAVGPDLVRRSQNDPNMRDTLALILAGGRGSRLGGLAARRAKPAVPFGGKFRIIDFTLSNCLNSGIGKVGVLLQYEGHSLIRHLLQGWCSRGGQFGEFVEPLPAEQRLISPGWYAGTADAVYQNIEFIKKYRPKQVFILAGDHIYRMDYEKMLAAHLQTSAQVTVGCVEVTVSEAVDFGVMQVDDSGRVYAFQEKPRNPQSIPEKPGRALASIGIYVFEADYLIRKLIGDANDASSGNDFGHDVLPKAIEDGHVYAYNFGRGATDAVDSGYWRDVGNIDAYWRANINLTDVRPEFDLYDERWPVVTHQTQTPPAKIISDGSHPPGGVTNALVSDGCTVVSATVRKSILFVNSMVEAFSEIDESLLLPGVRVGRRCTVRRAIVDEGCVIPDHFQIGCDLAADQRRFHVTPLGITLVTKDMLRCAGA